MIVTSDSRVKVKHGLEFLKIAGSYHSPSSKWLQSLTNYSIFGLQWAIKAEGTVVGFSAIGEQSAGSRK
jgi:hypothetical protein